MECKNKMKKLTTLIFIIVSFVFVNINAYSAQPTGEQLMKNESDLEKERALREQIQKPKPKDQIKEEENTGGAKAPAGPEEKTLIKNITIVGATLLPTGELESIVAPYKNKEVSLREMQKIADLITDAYRKKGYITSRAYLPPQKIASDNLEIMVMEGITGDVVVKGNHYFKASLIRNKIPLKKGEPFNYDKLRNGMRNINHGSDINAKAVLAPGKDPGTTDVNLEVKDRLPIHVGFDYDNFGSRYSGKTRYKTILTDNNLLGFDDSLSLQYQLTDAERFIFFSTQYLFPVNDNLKLGFLFARSKVHLGKELEDSEVHSASTLFSAYAIQTLVNTENTDIEFNVGLDYKNVYNFQAGVTKTSDMLRIAKTGLDIDITDGLGRTIFNNDLNFGIPDMWGGLDAKDPRSSRSGAGGQFTIYNGYLLRLQQMPFGSTILWKSQIQLTNNVLPSVEQFQLGGYANVRGYPIAEKVGDKGYTTTWEWSFPFYFIPKNITVPFSKAKLYDALKFDLLYDLGNVHLNSAQPGEKKNATLRSYGFGIRFNLPEDLMFRIDFCWPEGAMPSDGSREHTWVEFSKTF